MNSTTATSQNALPFFEEMRPLVRLSRIFSSTASEAKPMREKSGIATRGGKNENGAKSIAQEERVWEMHAVGV